MGSKYQGNGKGIPLDNKVVIMVVAALVIGLAAGYFITYTSYQAQLSSDKDQINDLNAHINDLTDIIAGLHPSSTPTPSPSATPTPTGSPSATSTPYVAPANLELFDENAGQDGNYYYVNFTVRNIGQSNCTLKWVYLNGASNQALAGVSGLFVSGNGHPPNAMLGVTLNVGDSVTIMIEGTAGDLTNTIWQPGMSVTAAVDTTGPGSPFTAGSYVSFPG
jgi:hypothetical protein